MILTAYDLRLAGIDFILFNDQLGNRIGPDDSAGRIEYAVNISDDLRVHRGIFKGKGRVQELAVFHNQVFYITHPLQALNRAVDQRQVLCVPAKVFSRNKGIVHRHIFAVPKGVLGQQTGAMDLHVFCPVEGIVAIQRQIRDLLLAVF